MAMSLKWVPFAAGLALAGMAVSAPASAATRLVKNQSAAAGLKLMSQLNVIVFDYMDASHDVEGKAWIGGDLRGNAWNVGIGNAKQGAVASNFSTLTVGGRHSGGTVNVNNGVNGKAGTVGGNGSYGVTFAGDSNGFNLNSGTTGRVKVGGSVNGKVQLGAGSSLLVGRNIASDLTLGSGSVARVGGSIGGNTTLASGVAGRETRLTVGGNTGQINGSDRNVIQVGGNVNGANLGTGSQLTMSGALTGNFNLNGDKNTVVRLGRYTGNSNPLNNGQTVYVGNAGTNKTGWFFSQPKPAAPAPIATADLPNVSAPTAVMLSDLTALSAHLKTLPTNGSNSIVKTAAGPGSTTYDWLFKTGAAATSDGYAVFNVTAGQLLGTTGGSVRNIGFDLGGTSAALPIVVNITGAGASTWNWNLNALGSAYGSALNQQIIWNFADATGTLNFNTLVHGSVLALGATVTNVTPIEGSVVARIFKQGGEVHLGTYNGNDRIVETVEDNPPAVPEPASWATMLIGFGFVGSMIRRRRGTLATA
ncbi:collagen-binding domain-containing protein [uncultured Sphingomonas sp.]|uniref:collagen-binding domain-containing protein n=1 Tax=uncultured Sphingomonas sp. TaxID=158754 RepID=UPI0025DDC3CC|nr:collagen-binding domain-containing protein [uncultured Sphingomonas sp.]